MSMSINSGTDTESYGKILRVICDGGIYLYFI